MLGEFACARESNPENANEPNPQADERNIILRETGTGSSNMEILQKFEIVVFI